MGGKGVVNTTSYGGMGISGGVGMPMMAKTAEYFDMSPEAAPVASDQRMIVQNSNLSMQVADVAKSLSGVEKVAVDLGGYMVDRNMTKPEGAASGNISVRVPVEKIETALTSIKALGMKTVSENVQGRDVTDQYVDIQGRLDNLNRTKGKMVELLDRAVNVSDLMSIQMQINSIQSQIDSYLGQQKYLEQTAKLTLISVYLSTDELSLPYAPDKVWRPLVVFKTAVRSMVGAIQSLGSTLIWLVVYIPVFLIIWGVFALVKRGWRAIRTPRA